MPASRLIAALSTVFIRRGGELCKVHRRHEADWHAEQYRSRRAVNACEDERQNAVLRLCAAVDAHTRPNRKRPQPYLPCRGNAGDNEVYRYQQHAAHRHKAEYEEYAVYYAFKKPGFVFHQLHLFRTQG